MTPRRIEDETPIVVHVIADAVIAEIDRRYPLGLSDEETRDLADRLALRADRLYASNVFFRGRIRARGNIGRDRLYAYMRHWLASEIKRIRPEVFRKIPAGFCMGSPIAGGP